MAGHPLNPRSRSELEAIVNDETKPRDDNIGGMFLLAMIKNLAAKALSEMDRADGLEAEVHRMARVIDRYGRCDPDCAIVVTDGAQSCDCGFDPIAIANMSTYFEAIRAPERKKL